MPRVWPRPISTRPSTSTGNGPALQSRRTPSTSTAGATASVVPRRRPASAPAGTSATMRANPKAPARTPSCQSARAWVRAISGSRGPKAPRLTVLANTITQRSAVSPPLTRRSLIERGRRPPGIEGWHIGARALGEARGALLEKRRDALAGIGRAPRPVHAPRVEAMRRHRMIGAEQAPHELARQPHRDRRGVLGDLQREGAGGGQQPIRLDDLAHQAARARLLRREDAARVDPLRGARHADQAREEP